MWDGTISSESSIALTFEVEINVMEYFRVSPGSTRFPLRSSTVFRVRISVFEKPENRRLSINAVLSHWLSPTSFRSIVNVMISSGDTGCSLPVKAVAPPSVPVGFGVVDNQSMFAGLPLVANTSKNPIQIKTLENNNAKMNPNTRSTTFNDLIWGNGMKNNPDGAWSNFDEQYAGANRSLMDDIIVPPGEEWTINKLQFFSV